eukprot:2837493-Amphidinium_carterae.1
MHESVALVPLTPVASEPVRGRLKGQDKTLPSFWDLSLVQQWGRFAIWQSFGGKRKLRVIDDSSVSGQNATVMPAESSTMPDSMRCLNLRMVDLTHAYKQLAVAADELKYTMTCMYSPENQAPVYWQNPALPFGATGSVCEFNAVATALEVILRDLVGVVASSIFDDYSLVELMVTAYPATKAVEALLHACPGMVV